MLDINACKYSTHKLRKKGSLKFSLVIILKQEG